jgi:hypothetical protein
MLFVSADIARTAFLILDIVPAAIDTVSLIVRKTALALVTDDDIEVVSVGARKKCANLEMVDETDAVSVDNDLTAIFILATELEIETVSVAVLITGLTLLTASLIVIVSLIDLIAFLMRANVSDTAADSVI